MPADRAHSNRLANPRGQPAGARARILVIDDERIIRSATRAILRQEGFDVWTAQDGEQGLKRLAEPPLVDLVILDLTMPGLSGADVFSTIQARSPGLRVLLASGHGERDVLRHFDACKPAGFIQKPYAATKLVSAVDAVLRAQSW